MSLRRKGLVTSYVERFSDHPVVNISFRPWLRCEALLLSSLTTPGYLFLLSTVRMRLEW